jgi:hypothetical protein
VNRIDRSALIGALVEHLMGVMSDPKSRGTERVRAVEALVDLLGLAVPAKSEIAVAVSPQSQPVTIDWEELDRLRTEVFGPRPAIEALRGIEAGLE